MNKNRNKDDALLDDTLMASHYCIMICYMKQNVMLCDSFREYKKLAVMHCFSSFYSSQLVLPLTTENMTCATFCLHKINIPLSQLCEFLVTNLTNREIYSAVKRIDMLIVIMHKATIICIFICLSIYMCQDYQHNCII